MANALQAARQSVRQSLEWLAWRISRPAHPEGPLRLHLGCGEIDYPGFVNIDGRARKHIHHVQGIDNLAAFADNSASLIYASHCLEHFSHLRVPEVLKEWHRVLRPGGLIRISVPDFDLMVGAYLDFDRDMQSMLKALMGGQDYAFNFHYTCFNRADLSRLLVEAGFKDPRPWNHGADGDAYASVPDWSGKPATYKGKAFPISLNIEAVK